MQDSVSQCERDVQIARTKLANDLAALRDPAVLNSFTRDLKTAALETKDSLMEQAKEQVKATTTDFVEDLKAKAAANPAAALSIGAGVAWHLLRHPPIATVLIATGLYSLLRTNGAPVPEGQLMEHARASLGRQTAEFGEAAANMTAEAAAAVTERVDEFASDAKNKLQGMVGDMKDAAVTAVRSQTEFATESARRVVHDAKDAVQRTAAAAQEMSQQIPSVAEAVSIVPERAQRLAHDARHAVRSVSSETRDTMLMGVAGVAVAAALGMAMQRWAGDPSEQ